MKKDFMFTSESVTEGHPDKLCDQISDAIVDQFLQRDSYSRVIAECAVSTAIIFISSRFESDAIVDFTKIARQVIKQVGYDEPDFNAKTCSIVTSLKELPANGNRYWNEKKLSSDEIEQISSEGSGDCFWFCLQSNSCVDATANLAGTPTSKTIKLCQVRKYYTISCTRW